MNKKGYKCLIVSDFTIDNFAALLSNDEELPEIEAYKIPYGQVMPVLINEKDECWKKKYDLVIVWTQPHSVIESLNDVLQYKIVDKEKLFNELDNYLSLLTRLSERVPTVIVPTWVRPFLNRGFGIIDMKPSFGLGAIIMIMNLKLMEHFNEFKNTFILDANQWIAKIHSDAYNPKMWYMGKIPFTNEIFSEAVKDVKAVMNGIGGSAKKCIVSDLDDTIWGGIVGDDGWENLNIGGHNIEGEAFVDFQKCLKALKNRGIILAIVSKNEESIAMEAIERHPEMILKKSDFSGWRINWNDKAQNISELVNELNIGLQSVVFLDDNPVERDRVRDALPEVLVPELPKDKSLYAYALQELRCFDVPYLSQEDLKRSEMYNSERKRIELKDKVGSLEDWLKTLEMKIIIEPFKSENLDRITQLINKTNQMNLSTRRLTSNEIINWNKNESTWFKTLRVSDKFGDSGLTGIVSLQKTDEDVKFIDFILSCRVMGRKIEEIMVHEAIEHAKNIGAKMIYAEYLPTKKNKPCFDFWLSSGFKYEKVSNRFYWDLKNEYRLHDFARIEIEQ